MRHISRLEFLEDIVFGWIQADIKRMLDNPVLPGKPGNLNYPIVLCVLAYIEYLGGFLLGEDKDFNQNGSKYIGSCFDNPDEYPVDILTHVFRNGLAHEYFPRGTITRDNHKPPLYEDAYLGIVLDANSLAEDFLKSLAQYKYKLSETDYQKRLSQAKERIRLIYKEYKGILPTESTKTTTVIGKTTVTEPYEV